MSLYSHFIHLSDKHQGSELQQRVWFQSYIIANTSFCLSSKTKFPLILQVIICWGTGPNVFAGPQFHSGLLFLSAVGLLQESSPGKKINVQIWVVGTRGIISNNVLMPGLCCLKPLRQNFPPAFPKQICHYLLHSGACVVVEFETYCAFFSATLAKSHGTRLIWHWFLMVLHLTWRWNAKTIICSSFAT